MTRKFLASKLLSFVIPGRPLAKGGDYRNISYGSREAYNAVVKMLAKNAMFEQGWEFETGPIYIAITINLHPPLSGVRKQVRADMLKNKIMPVRRPDINSLGKTVSTAMRGAVFEKDAQIVGLLVAKRYVKTDESIEVLVGTADTWRTFNHDLRNA